MPEANGILLPYPFQGEFYDSMDSDAPILDKAYDGSQPEILLTLPGDIKVSDLKWISVWCREYEVNFGDIIIKDDEYVEENKLDTGKDTIYTMLALIPRVDDNLGHTLSGLTQIGNIISKIFQKFTIFQVHHKYPL